MTGTISRRDETVRINGKFGHPALTTWGEWQDFLTAKLWFHFFTAGTLAIVTVVSHLPFFQSQYQGVSVMLGLMFFGAGIALGVVYDVLSGIICSYYVFGSLSKGVIAPWRWPIGAFYDRKFLYEVMEKKP